MNTNAVDLTTYLKPDRMQWLLSRGISQAGHNMHTLSDVTLTALIAEAYSHGQRDAAEATAGEPARKRAPRRSKAKKES